MAAPIRISGQTPLPISIARLRLRISSPLITITVRAAYQLKRNRRVNQIRQQGISIKEGMEINTSFLPHSVWHLCSAHVQAPTPRSNSNSNSNFRLSGGHSPSETVEQFYTCINDNNLEQLGMLLSDDCIYNDLSFPQPFKGKKVLWRASKFTTIVSFPHFCIVSQQPLKLNYQLNCRMLCAFLNLFQSWEKM